MYAARTSAAVIDSCGHRVSRSSAAESSIEAGFSCASSHAVVSQTGDALGFVDLALAGHTSAEPAHALALRALGLRPLLGLDLRLGEGTGALLALPLAQSAARALRDVATFDSAGVTEKS